MKKELYICFPDDRANSLNRMLLHTISVELQGYHYVSQDQKAEYNGEIYYYPKPSSLMFFNSFMPVIIMKEMPSSSGLCFSVTGKLTKIVRSLLFLLYAGLCIFQYVLIKYYFSGILANQFTVVIPLSIAILLFTMSTAIKTLATKAFAKKCKTQIERLITNEIFHCS